MPRPEERIDAMLKLLAAAWRRHPDQRLGQIIGNAARVENSAAESSYRDPFDVEDDEMWAGLQRLAGEE